ncbi:MAG: cyclopropane fatty acyl phospholipid synthase [Candidatus Magasanikbacteria bacterium]
MFNAQEIITSLAKKADIEINGNRPWDIQVHDSKTYRRVLSQGTLGLGGAYMDGWWDCEQIDEMVYRALHADLREHFKLTPVVMLTFLRAYVFNLGRRSRAYQVGERHYDTGNDLYSRMLDKRLTYTCAYWKSPASDYHMTLDEAQEAKLDLVCKKIGLKAGDKVLDIGCGWGSFAGFAAERYGAQVTGITISKQQFTYAQQRYAHMPIEFRLQDYREVDGQFDHIISLGMFEHVGVKNYKSYFDVVRRCLKDDGIFLLQTIGSNQSVHGTDPWIGTYIFPNSMLPSAKQITTAIEKKFIIEDWHSFGHYYDKTLMAWHSRFESAWQDLCASYDERFHRMWRYYLLSCAGLFRAHEAQLWQIVLSKHGVSGGYEPVR